MASELARVSKAGYVEVPSRAREIFVKERFARLKLMFGKIPEIGFQHHRWYCELHGDEFEFYYKGLEVSLDPARYITREKLVRKMTEAESGLGLFWTDSFGAKEVIFFSDGSLAEKKIELLSALENR